MTTYSKHNAKIKSNAPDIEEANYEVIAPGRVSNTQIPSPFTQTSIKPVHELYNFQTNEETNKRLNTFNAPCDNHHSKTPMIIILSIILLTGILFSIVTSQFIFLTDRQIITGTTPSINGQSLISKTNQTSQNFSKNTINSNTMPIKSKPINESSNGSIVFFNASQ